MILRDVLNLNTNTKLLKAILKELRVSEELFNEYLKTLTIEQSRKLGILYMWLNHFTNLTEKEKKIVYFYVNEIVLDCFKLDGKLKQSKKNKQLKNRAIWGKYGNK